MKTSYILTFEMRYTIVDGDDSEQYIRQKYTIDEFSNFHDAVEIGNKFIERLNLDHPTTPGINGDRLGTVIFGNSKKDLVRNYLRNSSGNKVGEIYIKISKVNSVDLENALRICDDVKGKLKSTAL